MDQRRLGLVFLALIAITAEVVAGVGGGPISILEGDATFGSFDGNTEPYTCPSRPTPESPAVGHITMLMAEADPYPVVIWSFSGSHESCIVNRICIREFDILYGNVTCYGGDNLLLTGFFFIEDGHMRANLSTANFATEVWNGNVSPISE